MFKLIYLFIWLSFVIVVVKNILCDLITEEPKIIFSYVIYRHGDRNPRCEYKNYSWINLNYWSGIGQLRKLGKEQQFNLGKWLRKRYDNTLLSQTYDNTEISVDTCFDDRCKESALSNLAGLYATNNQEWNEESIWPTTDILKNTLYEDSIYTDPNTLCPKFKIFLRSYMKTEEYNDNVTNQYNFVCLIDVLSVEQLHNQTLPEWTKTLHAGNMVETYYEILSFIPFVPQIARQRYGFLMSDILRRLNNKIEAKKDLNRTLWFYSGHDSSINGLLDLLNVKKRNIAEVASCLLFELVANEPYVQLYFKSKTNGPADLIDIPDCGKLCPLYRVKEIVYRFLPNENYILECGQQDSSNGVKSIFNIINSSAVFIFSILIICLQF